jgi:hypothetical protein
MFRRMHKKGIIAAGPALFFMPVISLLITSFAVMMGLGLVSGPVFNRRIKEMEKKSLYARILVVSAIMISVIIAVHYIGGPTSNHFAGMLAGAIVFGAAISLLSIRSFRENFSQSLKTILILTLIFLVVSELSVFLAMKIT